MEKFFKKETIFKFFITVFSFYIISESPVFGSEILSNNVVSNIIDNVISNPVEKYIKDSTSPEKLSNNFSGLSTSTPVFPNQSGGSKAFPNRNKGRGGQKTPRIPPNGGGSTPISAIKGKFPKIPYNLCKINALPDEFYRPKYSGTSGRPARELAVAPDCKGQVPPEAWQKVKSSKAKVNSGRLESILEKDLASKIAPGDEPYITYLLGNDPAALTARHTTNSHGAYAWYMPNVYKIPKTTRSLSEIYIGESDKVLGRVVAGELAKLERDRYFTNPGLQAAFKAAKKNGTGIILYIFADENEIHNDAQRKDLELVTINELNKRSKSNIRPIIVNNIKDNYRLIETPSPELVWPDSEYWDTFYKGKYEKETNKKATNDEDFKKYREQIEKTILKQNESFVKSERALFTKEEYLNRYNIKQD